MIKKTLPVMLIVAILVTMFSGIVPVNAASGITGTGVTIAAYTPNDPATYGTATLGAAMTNAAINNLAPGSMFTVGVKVSAFTDITGFYFFLNYSKNTVEPVIVTTTYNTDGSYVYNYAKTDKLTFITNSYTAPDLIVQEEDVGTTTSTTGNVVPIIKRGNWTPNINKKSAPGGSEIIRILFKKLQPGRVYIKAQPSQPSLAAGLHTGFQFAGADGVIHNAAIASQVDTIIGETPGPVPYTVDKSTLSALITESIEVKDTHAQFVPEADLIAFSDAIGLASAYNSDPRASQADIDAQYIALYDARNMFEMIVIYHNHGDKTVLYETIDRAIADKNATQVGNGYGNVSQEVMDEFANAIAAAQIVADTPCISQSTIDEAITVLVSEHAVFDSAKLLVCVDKTELFLAISAANEDKNATTVGYAYGNVTQEAMDIFTEEIFRAHMVADSFFVYQADVQSATAILLAAIAAFDAAKIQPPDKSVLIQTCTLAIDIQTIYVVGNMPGNVPQSAIFNLNAALLAAGTVIDSNTAQQAEVDRATARIIDMISALENSVITQTPVPPTQTPAARIISGLVSLPGGQIAPESGLDITVIAKTADDVKYYGGAHIRSGKSSAMYKVVTPANATATEFSLTFVMSTTGTQFVASSSSITVSVAEGNATHINYVFTVNTKSIQGVITLPNGNVAGIGGMDITIVAKATSGVKYYKSVHIVTGKSSEKFNISIPAGEASESFRLNYNIAWPITSGYTQVGPFVIVDFSAGYASGVVLQVV